jgi:hypothetical protein
VFRPEARRTVSRVRGAHPDTGAGIGRGPLATMPAVRASLLLALVVLAGLSPGASGHDDSRSRTLLVVEGERLSHFVRLQTLSVAEVLPLDSDGNGLVTEAELAAVEDDLASYVVEHVLLSPVGAGGPRGNLPGRLVTSELVTEDADALAFAQWIELEFERTAPSPPGRLLVEASLFLETSPTHVDWLDVVWAEARVEGAPLAPVARWNVNLRGGRNRVLLDSGLRDGVDLVESAWQRLVRRPELAAAAWMLLLTCAAARALRVAAAHAAGLLLGVGLAPLLADRLPALPLAAGLVLVVLGAVACLRPRPRPMGWEAAIVGLLMGLHVALPPSLAGPLDDLLLEPLERAAAAPETSARAGVWIAAASVGVVGLALALLLGLLPGARREGALVPARLLWPVAGLGLAWGGHLAWRAL